MGFMKKYVFRIGKEQKMNFAIWRRSFRNMEWTYLISEENNRDYGTKKLECLFIP